MSLNNPYLRIIRPGVYLKQFVTDEKYAKDRLQLSRAYLNLENELKNIFNYIEPTDNNKDVFSYELYKILICICTEVESNCKLILNANGYKKSTGGNLNMDDYKKIEQSSLLSKYKVVLNNWRNYDEEIDYSPKKIIPFSSFDGDDSKAPAWYKAYNNVKHNRESNFREASLDNCISALAGLLVLLYSQFGPKCVETYGISGMYWNDSMDDYGELDANILFDIIPPFREDWGEDNNYNFDWRSIKDTSPSPFNMFDYK